MTRSIVPDLAEYTVWFLTGSQGLYGEETLRQVAEQSKAVATGLQESSDIPVTVVWKPVLTDSDSIRRAVLEANADDSVIGLIAWMHTFSPAKMWIAGLDALQKPLLHLHTQANVELPWADIDFDFMNLNQAAHGDREFGYIESRLGIPRTTVVGHVSDPAVTAPRRYLDPRRGRTRRHPLDEARALRRQHALRRGHRGRQDRGRARVRRAGQHLGRERAGGCGARDRGRRDVDSLVAEYLDSYDVVPELRADGDRHESLRYGARIELGLRAFLEAGGFSAFTTSFEDLGSLKQLPGLAVQRLMADGYGFGAEGDWKTAVLVRTAAVMGAGLPGGASLMEDYTYHLEPGKELILGAHMLEVSPSLTTTKPSLEIHPLGIGGKDDPVRLVFTADAGPALVVALSDMRDRFRLVANVVENVALPAPLPNLPVGRAVWKPSPDFQTSAAAWLTAGAAHHTVMTTQVGVEVFRDFATMSGVELLVIDDDTTLDGFEREVRWNAAYYRLARGI